MPDYNFLLKEIEKRFKNGKRFSHLIKKMAFWYQRIEDENYDIYVLALIKDKEYGVVLADFVYNWKTKYLNGGFYKLRHKECTKWLEDLDKDDYITVYMAIRFVDPIVKTEIKLDDELLER